MKYEMIFGDEGLFFDAQKDCEMSGNGHYKVDCGKLMVWNFSEKYWTESHTNKITIQAMRRIIKEPKRWTLEDKKAGRLPDVGAELIHKTRGICYFVGVGLDENACWALKLQSGLIYIAEKSWCSPIETPEERAQRLRDEWIDSSLQKIKRRNWTDAQTFNQIKEFIGDIYDAQLSGELAAPTKGG